MTNGQLMFYMGIALLVVTVILVVIFALKKPKYVPESAAYISGNANTQKLRNRYPTNRLTIRRDSKQHTVPETVALSDETMPLEQLSAERPSPATDILRTEKLTEQGTKNADLSTMPLAGGTGPLDVTGEISPLETTVKLVHEETEILKTDEEDGANELNETVLLH